MERHTTDLQGGRQSAAQGKRPWLMIIGCSLPVVAFFVLPVLGVSWESALFFLFVLACSLMHLLGMHGGHHQPKGREQQGCLRKEG